MLWDALGNCIYNCFNRRYDIVVSGKAMAEQLESLKYTFREHGREAVVAQLGSCAQKVLRATAKAAGLAQQVSGRSLTTEELRQNLLEHALASTQVGVGWLGFFLLVSLNTNAVRQVTRINVFFVCVCQDLTKWIALCSPCQAAPSQSAGMKKLQQLKEILVEEGRERVQQELQGVPQNVMREVCKAAQLSVATPTGQTFVVAELRSAVLAHLLNQSDEPDEAGCVES